MLSYQMLWLGGLLVFIRLMLSKLARRKITAQRFFSALVWGAAPVILLFTGYEDFLYFWTRGMDIPQTLPWLDDNGLMPALNGVMGSPTTTAFSLYMLMGIGAVMIIGLFAIKTKWQEKQGLVTPI
jgi:hypothetical protein